jgi:FO synthase
MAAVIDGDEAGGSAADGRNARSAAAEDEVHRAVFGDVHVIANGVLAANAPRVEGLARTAIRREVAAALAKAQAGTVLDDTEALLLFETTGVELDALAAAADEVRADRVGDTVTYVVNRNINFTNVCYTGCRFCAFAQRRDDPDAYTLSLSQLADRAEEAWGLGATEVCMQGGIHPTCPATTTSRCSTRCSSGSRTCTSTPSRPWRSSTARRGSASRSESGSRRPSVAGSGRSRARPPRSWTTRSGGC